MARCFLWITADACRPRQQNVSIFRDKYYQTNTVQLQETKRKAESLHKSHIKKKITFFFCFFVSQIIVTIETMWTMFLLLRCSCHVCFYPPVDEVCVCVCVGVFLCMAATSVDNGDLVRKYVVSLWVSVARRSVFFFKYLVRSFFFQKKSQQSWSEEDLLRFLFFLSCGAFRRLQKVTDSWQKFR